jgi:hypothetical protein
VSTAAVSGQKAAVSGQPSAVSGREVLFLKPTFVPQAGTEGIGVKVKAEKPQLQLSAVSVQRSAKTLKS